MGGEEAIILKDVVVILLLAICVLLTCHRLHIPSLVGIILTGAVSGPHGLGLVSAVEAVDTISQIGLILLLFSIGMEFSLKRLLMMKWTFLGGGLLQVGLTTIVGFLITRYLGRPLGEALFFGCLISLSSTAIVLKTLQERSEEHSPHGHVITAILIFQDMIAIPMMLMVPLLAGNHFATESSAILLLGKGTLILAIAFLLGIIAIPRLFYVIAKTHSHTLFLLTVLAVCFTTAWISSLAGLSLSLGAFLAGLILSGTEYRHQAIGEVLPFQDVFTSLFFMSIGMLVDINYVIAHPLLVITVTVGIIALKALFAGVSTLVIGMPLRTVILSGLALSQVGEFSFVLARTGMQYHLGVESNYQLFLIVALLTMIACPLLIAIGPSLSAWICRFPLFDRLNRGFGNRLKEDSERLDIRNHVIIVGFGFLGKALAHCCKSANIPYVILEIDPEIRAIARENGEPIHFGDASHLSVLHHLNINQAWAIAIAVNDPATISHIVRIARRENPQIFILTRAHRLKERSVMVEIGADVVAVHEQEIAIALAAELLKDRIISESVLDDYIDWIRGLPPESQRSKGHHVRH